MMPAQEVLIIAWKCGCDAMGVITKEEFVRGFKAIRCVLRR